VRKVRVGNKKPPIGHQVGISSGENGIAAAAIETARSDQGATIDAAQGACRNRRCIMAGGLVAADAWLDDMQVGKRELVELLGDIAEGRGGIAVAHAASRAAGAEADADAALAPDCDRGFCHLKQEAGAILDRPTIRIGATIRSVLKKLVGKISVRSMDLDSVEPGLQRIGRGLPVFCNERRNLADRQRARHRVPNRTGFA